MVNKIFFSQAHQLGDGRLLVPFACTDANQYALHEPRYNRTDADNEKARELTIRIQDALSLRGYTLASAVDWFSMRLTISKMCK